MGKKTCIWFFFLPTWFFSVSPLPLSCQQGCLRLGVGSLIANVIMQVQKKKCWWNGYGQWQWLALWGGGEAMRPEGAGEREKHWEVELRCLIANAIMEVK